MLQRNGVEAVMRKASMLPAAKAFHDLGYKVVLVDFRGSGGSTGEGTTVGYREAEDFVKARPDEWTTAVKTFLQSR